MPAPKSTPMKILVADDQRPRRAKLAERLATLGHEVATADDGRAALDLIHKRPFDVVVCELQMPQIDGVELLRRVKRGPLAYLSVVGMARSGGVAQAVEAIKLGAYDVVARPCRTEDLLAILDRVCRENGAKKNQSKKSDAESCYDAEDVERSVIGQTAAMGRVRRMIRICARTDANVLLSGETGVGKDLIASVIHRNSHRRKAPFVKVGCTLFPSQLIESELYGHEKGAFTGAEQQRQGHFDRAEGGTFYLDDIDDVPLVHQAKLLRAIEEKVFERVGGTTLNKANVRIISSTKRNLIERIATGSFREDLYYRLDVLRINLPPLRERRVDIPVLINHLLTRIAGRGQCRIEPAAINLLEQHDWPGNIRELYHTLERAFLVGAGHITADLLRTEGGDFAQVAATPTNVRINGQVDSFHSAMQKTERELLEHALQAAGGNKTAAAAALGMRPSTFRDKLARHQLG